MRKASLNFEGLDFSYDSEDAIVSSFLQMSPLGEEREKINENINGGKSPEPSLETDPLSPLVDPLHTGVFHQEDLADILASPHLVDLDYELLSPIKFLDSPISVIYPETTSKTSDLMPINMESVHFTSTPEKVVEPNDTLTSNSEPVCPTPKKNNKEIINVAKEKEKDQVDIKTEVYKPIADISLLMQTPSKLATPTPSKCTFSASPAMHLSPTDLCLSSPVPSYISNLQKTNPILFKRQLHGLQSPSNLKKCAPNQEEDVQSEQIPQPQQNCFSGIVGGPKPNPKTQGQAKRENQIGKGESTTKGPRKKKENVPSTVPSKIVTRTSVRSKHPQPKTFSEKNKEH